MVVPSLSGGGAERVLVLLAQGLTALGHHVSVVTVFGTDHDFYSLPEGVDRVALNLGGTTNSLLQKIRANRQRRSALRRHLRALQPDVVISFLSETNVLVLLAARRLKMPVVVTEHMDPRKQRLPKPWAILRRLLYRTAARVVSVSAGVDAYFAWLPETKRAVIPNPIVLAELDRPAAETPTSPWPHTVMAMGRLEQEKGFDLLIHAFAQVAADFPDWGLTILGEGSERDRLESRIEDLDLADRARLPGAIHEPFAALKKADFFVLSSRHEGFGNALVEAMACGLAVIATDCWHTPPEIVRHGVDGILVPPDDAKALAAAMADLMSDPDKRRRLATEAVESAKRYDLALVSQTWGALLETVVAPRDASPPESAATSPR